MDENLNNEGTPMKGEGVSTDYSQVLHPARVAVYDDPLIAPRIITIQPTTTTEFIQNLAVCIDEQARRAGGSISYTVILEVTENFIHAQFREIVVSILDGGNTIRFTDQGPGIVDPQKAMQPGFTSAIEPMKRYIRGVGSGLPIVHDWMELKNGHITVENNIGSGAAVTISLVEEEPEPTAEDTQEAAGIARTLGDKECQVLRLFAHESCLGITEISRMVGLGPSSVTYQVRKLEAAGVLVANAQKKREITKLGIDVLRILNKR